MTTQERLSALDASFLYLDSPSTPMHISSLAVYEGPAPDHDELKRHLASRLTLVPRFRQRLEMVPLNGHRPVWIGHEDFDLDSHLNHTALPAPGTEAQLRTAAGQILSQPLCRTRPLWEMWLIDGLDHNRFAILSKTHHALWDGVSGVDLHSVLLDLDADCGPIPRMQDEPCAPPPSRAQIFTKGIRDRIGDAFGLARDAVRAARNPIATIKSTAELAAGSASLAASLLRPAPASSLNAPLGSRRRYELGRASLHDVRALKDEFGTTINDAVLASVAGGLRQWHRHRGMVPRDMKVMVPVNIRDPRDRGTFGNRVAMLVIPLPVSQPDPLLRLKAVHRTMKHAKSSAQISAGEAFLRMSSFFPPQVVAAVSRAQAHYRSFNLLVTNVPGPQFPLYLRGRRLLELFPQAPLAANQGLSIGALSYDGRLGFGLLADHTIVPDIGVLREGLEESMDELTRFVMDVRPSDDRVPVMAGRT
ncbi:MAG TPA: wax ester/triacylglycerol synthase family O-acyltransferase [Actinomycetota bacterium]|jgi:WS/DGAT/MGAT family acyltransferase|nr:wax ester/triacylglycerol synthase family O-acyltransferase [Actinomycetota bacterium]